MRVVVGKKDTPTPIFSDTMTYVVFAPYWNVPPDIVEKETLPSVMNDPVFLERTNMEVVDKSGKVLDPNWRRVNPAKIRMRQRPGSPTNPLGLVKFMFPNQFAVYLHDTPAREMFSRPARTLSHGCVWVEKPVELADYVLAGQNGWDGEKIREAMETPDSASGEGKVDGQTVTLERPVPVYIVYLTAFMRDGDLNFRRDPYGKAREALAGLGKPNPSDPRLCEELQRLLAR